MHEDQDIIDVEDDNLEDTDVIDAQDSPAVTCRALKTRPASAGAVVPYQPARLPAVIPQLGDLEAYIRAANLAPILSAEEEHDLAVRLRDAGDLSAAQQLVLSHLRLVVSVARGYLGYGLPYADLIQEGNDLFRALDSIRNSGIRRAQLAFGKAGDNKKPAQALFQPAPNEGQRQNSHHGRDPAHCPNA